MQKLISSEVFYLKYIEQTRGVVEEIEQATTTNPVGLYKENDVYVFSRKVFPRAGKYSNLQALYLTRPKSYIRKLNVDRSDATHVEEGMRYILVDRCGGVNYFHWFSQVIPALCFCIDKLGSECTFVFHELNGWQRKTLEYIIDESVNILVLEKRKVYKFASLEIPSLSFRGGGGKRQSWFLNHPDLFKFKDRVVSRVLSCSKEKKDVGEKVYVSRRGNGRRQILNEDAVERLAIEKGFVVVKPEEYSFEDQVSIFQSAKYILSPTGAALANVIFCNPGACVGIFQPTSPKYRSGGYSTFASLLGLDPYVYLEYRNDDFELSPHFSDFSVSLRYFENFVDSFLKKQFPKPVKVDHKLDLSVKWE